MLIRKRERGAGGGEKYREHPRVGGEHLPRLAVHSRGRQGREPHPLKRLQEKQCLQASIWVRR